MAEPDSLPPPPPTPPIRYAITAPGAVSGGVMGVGFANGQGLINDATQHARALAWFRAEPGYKVEALDVIAPEPAAESEDPGAPGEDPPEQAATTDDTDEDSEEQPWL